MAKGSSEVVTHEEKTTAVAVSHNPGLPVFLQNDVVEYAGAGLSTDSKDFILPFLYVAQNGSPQLKKQQPDKYIPGLEVGDIFNTATGQFWKGDVGIALVHAYFQKAEVEWITRADGGGYVATHPTDTSLKSDVRLSSDGRSRMLPNGHQLVETNYHFCVDAESATPLVVGCSSSAIQASRAWNSLMRNFKIKTPSGDLVSAPGFARVYRMKTVYKKNESGDWFVPVFIDEGWVTEKTRSAFNEAKKFYDTAMSEGVQMGRPPIDEAGVVASDKDIDAPI